MVSAQDARGPRFKSPEERFGNPIWRKGNLVSNCRICCVDPLSVLQTVYWPLHTPGHNPQGLRPVVPYLPSRRTSYIYYTLHTIKPIATDPTLNCWVVSTPYYLVKHLNFSQENCQYFGGFWIWIHCPAPLVHITLEYPPPHLGKIPYKKLRLDMIWSPLEANS